MSKLLVETNNGTVRGLAKKTDQNCGYLAFFEIPYATQPLTDLRFRDPLPPKPWEGILDATTETKISYTFNLYTSELEEPEVDGCEDSLVLNVFTPSQDLKTDKLPVIVYIHDGEFIKGSNSSDRLGPDYLMEKHFILVAMNYRLGILGFLSFSDPSIGIPGNAGLKDQVMALRWVQENIEHFGGDPKNVTLMGHGTGAAAVHFHMLSPMSKDLFHKACLFSGSALMPEVLSIDPLKFNKRLAKYLKSKTDEEKKMFEIISSAYLPNLVTVSFGQMTYGEHYEYEFESPFIPTVEAYDNGNCFLPKHPKELQKDAWSCNIPMIMVETASEGLIYLLKAQIHLPRIEKDDTLLLPFPLRSDCNSEKKIQLLKKTYFENAKPLSFDAYLKYMGHRNIQYPIYRAIANSPNPKKYLCCLDSKHRKEFPACKFYWEEHGIYDFRMQATTHLDDIVFLFKIANEFPISESFECWKVSQRYLNAIVEFVNTGSPGDGWEPFGADENCLHVGQDTWEMGPVPYKEEMSVWDTVYDVAK